MIPIARPLLGEEELAAVREVLASGMLAQGAKVEAFERAFAKDLGRKHAIAVTSGTAALHVALLAHGIGPGQEVVIPPLTFFATASTVLLCGAKPVFVDIDRSSYNMDPAKVASAITRKTAAILPVHLYGQTAEMDPILAGARDRRIAGIEGLVPPAEGNWMVHSYYQYIVRREEPFPRSREEIIQDLTEDGIGCRPSYPMPLYKQKALRDLKIRGRCPVAEDVIPGLFELPVHPGVGPAEIERIVAAVEELARTD